jgi:hypothetical protein
VAGRCLSEALRGRVFRAELRLEDDEVAPAARARSAVA